MSDKRRDSSIFFSFPFFFVSFLVAGRFAPNDPAALLMDTRHRLALKSHLDMRASTGENVHLRPYVYLTD